MRIPESCQDLEQITSLISTLLTDLQSHIRKCVVERNPEECEAPNVANLVKILKSTLGELAAMSLMLRVIQKRLTRVIPHGYFAFYSYFKELAEALLLINKTSQTSEELFIKIGERTKLCADEFLKFFNQLLKVEK